MTTEHLTCHIAVASGADFPDDAHPLWAEIDALGDKIAASLKARGVAPDSISRAIGNGSHLTVSSDAPDDCFYCWIELPSQPAVRAQWLSLCLDHLTRARQAFPDADWDVCIGERPVGWRGGEFRDEDG